MSGDYKIGGGQIDITTSLTIYGGFSGTESSVESRDFGETKITYTGDNIAIDINLSGINVVIDGFTISSSNQNAQGIKIKNASDVTIKNSTITGGSYFGISISNANTTLTVSNCAITGNKYGININNAKKVDVSNSTIANNTYAGIDCYTLSDKMSITNCTFTSNGSNGAIYLRNVSNNNVSADIVNCTIVSNGKEFYFYDSGSKNVNLKNTIIWNSDVSKLFTLENNAAPTVSLDHCALPENSTLPTTSGTWTSNDIEFIPTTWSPVSNDETIIRGVKHTIFRLEENAALKGFRGVKIEEVSRDQIEKVRSSIAPTIGAIEFPLILESLDVTLSADHETLTLTQGSEDVINFTPTVTAIYDDTSTVELSSGDYSVSW
ncbi:MAG: right-handed parallel beta-helix repeat-containing protein, partial [Synergistaceae bacterium]|nr:right-handed parallel beta-helix repeat-containing protein [Synergistaceae bacterium]